MNPPPGKRIVLLLDDPAGVRTGPGWINVDPFAESPVDPRGRIRCDPTRLDPVVHDGEAIELIADGILDHVPGPEVESVLSGWAAKIASDSLGSLCLVCTDARAVARALHLRTIDPETARRLLYGTCDGPARFRRSAFGLDEMRAILEEKLGLRVVSARLLPERFAFFVRAVRPPLPSGRNELHREENPI